MARNEKVKKYLISDDEYSGKVVIECREYDKYIDVYKPTESEILANKYLFRKIPHKWELKHFYSIKGFWHYGEKLEGYADNCLIERTTDNKDEANQLFLDIAKCLK